jgi:hypothetical protein
MPLVPSRSGQFPPEPWRHGSSMAAGSALEPARRSVRKPSRPVLLECAHDAEDDTTNVAAVADRLVAGARVGWICNTVREAQRAFRAVSACADEVEHSLFHARFRGCDRRRIEEGVLERYGKAAPPGGRVSLRLRSRLTPTYSAASCVQEVSRLRLRGYGLSDDAPGSRARPTRVRHSGSGAA